MKKFPFDEKMKILLNGETVMIDVLSSTKLSTEFIREFNKKTGGYNLYGSSKIYLGSPDNEVIVLLEVNVIDSDGYAWRQDDPKLTPLTTFMCNIDDLEVEPFFANTEEERKDILNKMAKESSEELKIVDTPTEHFPGTVGIGWEAKITDNIEHVNKFREKYKDYIANLLSTGERCEAIHGKFLTAEDIRKYENMIKINIEETDDLYIEDDILYLFKYFEIITE